MVRSNLYDLLFHVGMCVPKALYIVYSSFPQTVLKLIGNTGGRVTVFNASIPTLGPGALKCRETHDDLTKPGPDHLRPASDFYRNIALDFSSAYVTTSASVCIDVSEITASISDDYFLMLIRSQWICSC